MTKERKLTVRDLSNLLDYYKLKNEITDDTEIWLSSDEEGNSMSPLMKFKSGMFNIGVGKKKFILYPSSMHSEY